MIQVVHLWRLGTLKAEDGMGAIERALMMISGTKLEDTAELLKAITGETA